MSKYIPLNEPASNTTPTSVNTTPTSVHSPAPAKHRAFIVLPLLEQGQSVPPYRSHVLREPNRHPTHLLKHFPPRPHYYLLHTVGAQAGYCLSPLPPSPKDTSYWNLTTPPMRKTPSNPSNKLAKTSSASNSTTSEPSSSVSASSSSSSLPSSSHTVDSSSTSSSLHTSSLPISPLTQTIELIKTSNTSAYSVTKNHPPCDASPNLGPDVVTSAHPTAKKVLPIPPSLSLRVRQVFINKINSQQAESCAQLPRRKKKKAVDPVA